MTDPEGTTPTPLPPTPPAVARTIWNRTAVRIAAWLSGLALAGALSAVIVLGIALAVAYPNLPEISGLTDYRPKLPLRVYSTDNVLIGEFGEERRNYTPIDQIPQILQDAVLAVEDTRFYSHKGVDYVGVIRAGLANLGQIKSQGASTITMQVARNFYLSTEKTFTRKIYEVLLALKIEGLLTKQQILEIYMNQIFLGHRAYGFAAASDIYFGKSLQDITLGEAAMLAGLPKAPSAYNPINNPKRARSRQLHILERMLVNGFITEEQYDAAVEERVRITPVPESRTHAEYVAETVRQLVYAQYGEEAYSRGLDVYTTINAEAQLTAYRALRRGIMDFERRQPYRGPEAYVILPKEAEAVDEAVAEALADRPDNDDLLSAVVLEASPRKVLAIRQNGETLEITGEGLRAAQSGLSAKSNPNVRIRRGAVIRVSRLGKNGWQITQRPEVEGALVAIDPRNGSVRTLVGGFDYQKNKFNHVTQAWRQPGSSFKPFIISAALEKGFTPATVVNDAPLFFDADVTGSQPWEPKNYDGEFDGLMSLRRGLAKSKNMISIRVLQAIGPPYTQEWVTRFGFDADRHPPYLTMALGSGTTTPMQMATAYSVFANGGYLVEPYLVTRVTDYRGKVLVETKPPVLDESMRVLPARNAFVMNSLLQEVTHSGTAARAHAALKRPDIYGKTGTTNDSMDAWFAGYQPTLAAVVWIGYDTPRKLGERETGGVLALPVWINFMEYALKDAPVQEQAPPEGVVYYGEWFYEEFSRGNGVLSLGTDDPVPFRTTDFEKKSILDLFKP